MEKKLRRTRYDNVVSGVAGGLAKYFNIDVTIVRALWLIGLFMIDGTFLVYLLCSMIIPKESVDTFEESTKDEKEKDPEYQAYKERKNKTLFGLLLVGVGAVMAFNTIFPSFTDKFFWPVLFIGGGFLLLNRKRNSDAEYDRNDDDEYDDREYEENDYE
jgi:phage shock protein PspC (stress-responsive transcriptional regulator)